MPKNWIAGVGGFHRRPIVRSVLKLTSGTATAQAITLAFYPIITRLYGAEAFGALGSFMALISIAAPLAVLGFPLAVVLPEEESEARVLMRLGMVSACAVSAFALLTIILFSAELGKAFDFGSAEPFIFAVPVAMTAMAAQQLSQQWHVRAGAFGFVAAVGVAQALILNGARTIIGVVHPATGVLILTFIGATILQCLALAGFAVGSRAGASSSARPSLRATFAKYRDFPLYRMPQDVLNATSQGLPVLILASTYGAAPAGLFALARSVLAAPLDLIGSSVGNVLYPRMAEIGRTGGRLFPVLVQATVGMSLIGALPFLSIGLFAPAVFAVVFGAEWREAGEYARWLAVWLAFMFANVPSVRAVPVLSIQGTQLTFTVAGLAARAGVMYGAVVLGASPVVAVAAFSVVGAVLNVFLVATVLRAALVFDRGGRART